MLAALPSAALASVVQHFYPDRSLALFGEEGGILTETQVWGGFTFLVSFLIVFRTSQSYTRWWEGCEACVMMRGEWFNAASSLISFCRFSKADPSEVEQFRQLLVRLISMLHATAAANIETGGHVDKIRHEYHMLSPDFIDFVSLETYRSSANKVELVFQWIQQVCVENIDTGVLSIPAPLLSRSFQELARGLLQYHAALMIAVTQFPYAYMHTCDLLLYLHWMIVPLVTSQWTTHWFWAGLFAFVQVFVVWTLNLIAIELEMPFGTDVNDVDGTAMQLEFNEYLEALIAPGTQRTPNFVSTQVQSEGSLKRRGTRRLRTLMRSDTDASECSDLSPRSTASFDLTDRVVGTSKSDRPTLEKSERPDAPSFLAPALPPHCEAFDTEPFTVGPPRERPTPPPEPPRRPGPKGSAALVAAAAAAAFAADRVEGDPPSAKGASSRPAPARASLGPRATCCLQPTPMPRPPPSVFRELTHGSEPDDGSEHAFEGTETFVMA